MEPLLISLLVLLGSKVNLFLNSIFAQLYHLFFPQNQELFDDFVSSSQHIVYWDFPIFDFGWITIFSSDVVWYALRFLPRFIQGSFQT